MSESQRTILQIVHLDETGDSYHRMRWPASTLATQKTYWRVLNFHWTGKERFELAVQADLLVLFQCSDPFMLKVIAERKARGRKTLVEYNDNFYCPAPASPVAKEWSSPLLWQTYETFLKEADGVIVTGEKLKELFSTVTSAPIYILRNDYHHKLKDFDTLWEQKGDEIKLGWAGSLGHFSDIIAFRDVIEKSLKKHPELRFSFMGNDELFSYLRLPPARVQYKAWGSMEEYLSFWQSIHIGIAPLLDHPYNHCRSDVKAIEMAGSGTMPLLSNVAPYEHIIKQAGIPSFKTPKQLEALLKKYLSDIKGMRNVAKNAHEYVSSQRVAANNFERAEIYEGHFPKDPAQVSLALPSGYFELRGTREKKSPSSQILDRVEQLKKEKKDTEIITVLMNNSCDRDLLLSGLRMLFRRNPAQAIHEIEKLIPAYPSDLRFLLLLARHAPSADMAQSIWQRIIKKLGKENESFVRFYGLTLIKSFIQQLEKFPSLAPCITNLIDIYPQSIDLHFTEANYLLLQNDKNQAKQSYEKALKLVELLELNDASHAYRSPIESWLLALE